MLFKPVVEQPRSEDVSVTGLDFGGFGTRSESVPDLGGFKIRAEPVSDVDEAEPEPLPDFEDFLRTSFDNLDRVTDIDLDEELQTPTEITQSKSIQIPQSGKGHRTRRFKTPVDEQISRLFVICWACKQNRLPLLHNQNRLPQNPLPNLP